MSENYKDKDIEKLIFGEGLASGSIEPSEKFWNTAYENIIQRENRGNLKRASRWRTGFYFMGTIALLLVLYSVYMQNEVSGIKQQLTAIEDSHPNTVQQNTSLSETANTTANTSAKNNLSDKNIVQNNEGKTIASVPVKHEHILSNENKTEHTGFKLSSGHTQSTTLPLVANITSNGINNQSGKTSSTPVLNKETVDINNTGSNTTPIANVPSNINTGLPPLSNTKPTVNNGITEPTVTEKNTAPLADKTPSPIPNKTPSAATTSARISPLQNTKTVSANKSTDSIIAASHSDSANMAFTPKKTITLAGVLSKTSVSAFYAPGITDDFLNTQNNDPTNTITARQLKTQQDGDGTFAIGGRLTYDISDKWAIQTGAYYSNYSYNINPTIIHAQQQENGLLGYSITTSSGTVFLPNSSIPTPHLGDSIKVKGSCSRGYISIPLQAKYQFAASRHLSFYVDGGLCLNIAKKEQTQIHWNNTALQEGDITAQSIYGLNSIEYSYNLGFGASYLIGKGLSIYTEPFVNGSFTSLNKEAPVIIYPYFFGWSFGVTYHF